MFDFLETNKLAGIFETINTKVIKRSSNDDILPPALTPATLTPLLLALPDDELYTLINDQYLAMPADRRSDGFVNDAVACIERLKGILEKITPSTFISLTTQLLSRSPAWDENQVTALLKGVFDVGANELDKGARLMQLMRTLSFDMRGKAFASFKPEEFAEYLYGQRHQIQYVDRMRIISSITNMLVGVSSNYQLTAMNVINEGEILAKRKKIRFRKYKHFYVNARSSSIELVRASTFKLYRARSSIYINHSSSDNLRLFGNLEMCSN